MQSLCDVTIRCKNVVQENTRRRAGRVAVAPCPAADRPAVGAEPYTIALDRHDRRQQPRVPELVLTQADRAPFPGAGGEQPSAVRRAILWEENPDLTACLRTLCMLAGMELLIVTTLPALLAAIAEARPGDILFLDCSWALPTSMGRCATVVIQTAHTLYVIHPRPGIVDALQDLARGPVHWLAPELAGLVFLEHLRLLAAVGTTPLPVHLTSREQEVLTLVGKGLTNAQIAPRLGVSESTVKTHVANVLGKLGLHTRHELTLATRPPRGD